MNKTVLTLVWVLLFSAVAGVIFVNLAMANPAPLFSFAKEPVTSSPTITVNSPVQNQTYNSTEVGLNLTIVKPETWFAFNVGFHADRITPINQTFVNITSVYYVVDNGERQNIPVHDIDDLFDVAPIFTLNLTTMLPLTPGTHNIKVGIEAKSYYVVKYVYNRTDALSSVSFHEESDIVNFTIAKPDHQPPELFPTTLVIVSACIVAVVGLGLFVYFKKRKGEAKPS